MSSQAAPDFLWRDAGRTVVFRGDALEAAPGILAGQGFEPFELFSTPRALAEAGELSAAAAAVHEVAPGGVPEAAAEILDAVESRNLVALGGGRVIDTAKAVAAVNGARVAAIPTTLSGAEMTGIHRLPAGAESRVRSLVRAGLVLADPIAMTGLPEPLLRASGLHALAHGADSLYTPFANPVSRMAALRGAELIAAALSRPRESRDRASIAQGAILCGYAIDSGGFSLHHVICQTLVRVCGSPHAETNAAILPPAAAFLAPRVPEQMSAFAEALGTRPDELADRIRELGDNPPGLGELGADRSKLDQATEAILSRPELAYTPSPPTREELNELIERAW
jgi:alcohol dehydrogenase class IV